MNLIVNGEAVQLSEAVVTVHALLEHFGLSHKIVIVEVDEHIVDKELFSQFTLQDGAKVELVHFVGGG